MSGAGQRYPNFSDANLRGAFFRAFEDAMAPSYLPSLTTHIESDKASELYGWLGAVPVMREWKGGRQKKQVAEYDWTIWNRLYESSLGVSVDDVRRDKFSQHEIKASELGQRAAENPILLLSTLLEDAESSACYDTQYFFDTDHVEGNSGTNNNDITYAAATGTTPTVDEMIDAILENIQQFYTFKDDQGQPVNHTAKNFAMIYPVTMMKTVQKAMTLNNLANGADNPLKASSFNITPYCDPRLSWTTKFAMFRTDHPVKPFIHQIELDNEVQSITDGNSDYVILNREYFFGVTRIEAVGYGDYKKACLTTFT